jgi:hypothetical protein
MTFPEVSSISQSSAVKASLMRLSNVGAVAISLLTTVEASASVARGQPARASVHAARLFGPEDLSTSTENNANTTRRRAFRAMYSDCIDGKISGRTFVAATKPNSRTIRYAEHTAMGTRTKVHT